MSGRSVRVFLDANTIVSGILFKGNEATLLELGRVKAVELVTNYYVLEDVTRVMRREEFGLIIFPSYFSGRYNLFLYFF